jgi:hypothetical protein
MKVIRDENGNPLRRILENKGELYDRIATMISGYPDYKQNNHGDAFWPHYSLDGTFDMWLESLELIRKKFDEEQYNELVSIANESRTLLLAKKDTEGILRLQDIWDVIKRPPKRKK